MTHRLVKDTRTDIIFDHTPKCIKHPDIRAEEQIDGVYYCYPCAVLKLKDKIDLYISILNAKNDLLTCYRLQKPPPRGLIDRLAKLEHDLQRSGGSNDT
jgi:hypothetical protein